MSWEEEIMPVIIKPTKFSQTLLTDLTDLELEQGLEERFTKDELQGEKYRRKKTLGIKINYTVDLYFDNPLDRHYYPSKDGNSLQNEVLFYQHQSKRMKQI